MKFNRSKQPFIPRLCPQWFLRPLAGGILVGGHILILLSLCHFAFMISGEGQSDAILYIDAYMGSIAASAVLLWATVLGVDWMERSLK